MKQITSYETTDGKLFKDEEEAKAHEKDLETADALRVFVDKHCYSGMHGDDIFGILFEKRDELRRILA